MFDTGEIYLLSILALFSGGVLCLFLATVLALISCYTKRCRFRGLAPVWRRILGD